MHDPKARPVRLGAVSYHNTRPLLAGLDPHTFEVVEAVPAECWRLLAAREVDLGIIPVIGLAEDPELVIVPDVAIAARGPVRSVLLLTRRPLHALRSVAVDRGSRASVAMLRIVLRERYAARPEMVAEEPSWRRMLAARDAALVIGDAALAAAAEIQALPGTDIRIVDLGAEWMAMTGLPFVFAVWAGPPDRVTPEVVEALITARDRGLDDIEAVLPSDLAAAERARLADYLAHAVHYGLGEEEMRGLERFLDLAHAHGLVPRRPELRVAPAPATARLST